MITTWGAIQSIVGLRQTAYVFRPLHETDKASLIFKQAISGHLIFTDAANNDASDAVCRCEVWFIAFDDDGRVKYERVC